MSNESKNQQLAPVQKRFVQQVQNNYLAEVGKNNFTKREQQLAQHLFTKIDHTMKDLQSKGSKVEWKKIDLQKLSIDAVHIVNTGLDPIEKNYLNPIPYWNKDKGKYDLDLRIGYAGKDYLTRKRAYDDLVNITYELVYSNDLFTPIKKSGSNNFVESYEFEIKEPFNRGNIVGGFGYIEYKDSRKNKLIIVTERDFERAKNSAKADKSGKKVFWEGNEVEMKLKTVVHRTCDKVPIDPAKNNVSFAMLENMSEESEINESREQLESGLESEANTNPIDIEIDSGEEIDQGTGEVTDIESEEQEPDLDSEITDEEIEPKPKKKLPKELEQLPSNHPAVRKWKDDNWSQEQFELDN